MKYHTFFDWKKQESQSINKFLSFFGDCFKTEFKKLVSADQKLSQSIVDFIYIGGTSNLLVHSNYAAVSFDLTLNDVLAKYQSSKFFISTLAEVLRKEICFEKTTLAQRTND